MKNKIYLFIVTMIFGGCSHEQNILAQQLILWPGSSAYKKKIESFILNEKQAHKKLVEKTRDHPDRFFDKSPIFVVGDEYFFAEPAKAEIPIQGFYLNGKSGVIEYKKSSVSVKKKKKVELPKGAFTEIQKIE